MQKTATVVMSMQEVAQHVADGRVEYLKRIAHQLRHPKNVHQLFFHEKLVFGNTVMQSAIQGGHISVVQWMDKNYFDHKWTEREWSIAARNGHLHICKYFVAREIDVNDPLRVMMPLAIQFGHDKLVTWLLDMKGEACWFFETQWDAMILSCVWGRHFKVLKILSRANIWESESVTPMPDSIAHAACVNGHVPTLALLHKSFNLDLATDKKLLDSCAQVLIRNLKKSGLVWWLKTFGEVHTFNQEELQRECKLFNATHLSVVLERHFKKSEHKKVEKAKKEEADEEGNETEEENNSEISSIIASMRRIEYFMKIHLQ